MLRQRVGEASAFVDMERLCLSPQCGFSGNVGNTVMSADEQFRKLRLVVDTARSLWADA
jgi:5-methyltetrahydropteroyltriglutamate--homocysteine methyltransferase